MWVSMINLFVITINQGVVQEEFHLIKILRQVPTIMDRFQENQTQLTCAQNESPLTTLESKQRIKIFDLLTLTQINQYQNFK